MLAAGDTLTTGSSPFYFPQSGQFILTSTADPDNYTAESDETDNSIVITVNVP